MIISINGNSLLSNAEQNTYDLANHHHMKEKWFGLNGVAESMTPYQAISGNSVFGTAIVLFTAAQTPITAGYRYYDPHRIMVISASKETLYYIRFIWGTTTADAEETAGNWSEFPWLRDIALGLATGGNAIDIGVPKLKSGIDNLWCKVKNTTNLATLSLFVGIHEYLR